MPTPTLNRFDPDAAGVGAPVLALQLLVEQREPRRVIPILVLPERDRPVPVLAPTREQAVDFVEKVRANVRFGDDPCGSCELYLWDRDDRASYCSWGVSRNDPIEDCNAFDADLFEQEQWKAIEEAAEELPA